MKSIATLFDYDDVLFPLIPTWVDEINNTYGTDVNPDNITDWDIAKFFPSLTKEQVFNPVYKEDIWKRMKPFDGVVDSLLDLHDNDYIVKIVTATSYHNVKIKMETLFKYFPFLSWEKNVHITSDKQSVKGYALVDDKIENLIGGEYEKILVNKPHNRKMPITKDIFRVNDVIEACELIKSWIV